jgi:hypothetical protein
MDHRQVVEDRDRWRARRIRDDDGQWCLGASEMGMMLGVAPETHGGPWSLYHRKVSGVETMPSGAMRRGQRLEPDVEEGFAESYPDLVVKPGGLYRSAKHPRFMATFDALTYTVDTPIVSAPAQYKTAAEGSEYGSDGGVTRLPPYVRAQGLTEMVIWESDHVYVPVLHLIPWVVVTYILERDAKAERDISLLLERGYEFLDMMDRQEPPPVDDTDAAAAVLRQLYGVAEGRSWQAPVKLARRYRAALRSKAKAERRYRLARNQLLEGAGDASLIVTRDREEGRPMDDYLVRVATRTSGPREAYKVKAAERVDRLNPGGWARSS